VAFLSKDTQKTCLLAVGKSPNTVSGIMQWALSTIQIWCKEVSLSANPAFTRKRKLQGFFEPQLFGVKLRFSGSVKHLGVILDSRLTWREHVEIKVRKAHNLMWTCRRACRLGWGSRSQGGSLALCCHRLTDHLLCILSMMAQMSNGQ
jgi:hypothetical protein